MIFVEIWEFCYTTPRLLIIIKFMLTLEATARDVSIAPKHIRKLGMVPAVYYGKGQESVPVTVDAIALSKMLRDAGESTIISLKAPKGTLDVLIHDVQVHPVTSTPIHVDFYLVDKNQTLEVHVPIEFTGIATAEKAGAVVVKVLHEILVEALPAALPSEFVIDLSVLKEIDDHILISDLVVPVGVTVLHDLDDVIVVATRQQEEEEVETIDLASIEVEKKGKKEESED